jgi:hypothetical protein
MEKAVKSGAMTICLATAAGLLLAAGPVQAQQELAEEEIRAFFDTMDQTATEAVQSGSFESLLEWTQGHIAEEAHFAVSNELYAGEERKGFGVISLGKDDMMRFGRMAVGMLSGMQGQPIEDYSLEIEIGEITPFGPDAATVVVDYTESATFAAPSGEGEAGALYDAEGGGAENQSAEAGGSEASPAGGQPVEITATAKCRHVVRRGETGGELALGLSTCEARTEL